MSQTPWLGKACCLVLPPYCNLGGGRTRPLTSIKFREILRPNSCTYGSLLRSAFLTRLLISLSLSGADLAVALIMVLVCMSVNFLMHLWPWTI